MKGWSRAAARSGGWTASRPCCTLGTEGRGNFAWEDPDEHQAEEEFSSNKRAALGSSIGPQAITVFGGSILPRQLGEIPGNQADRAAPSLLPAFIQSLETTGGARQAAASPAAGMQELERFPCIPPCRDGSHAALSDPGRRGDSLPCSIGKFPIEQGGKMFCQTNEVQLFQV